MPKDLQIDLYYIFTHMKNDSDDEDDNLSIKRTPVKSSSMNQRRSKNVNEEDDYFQMNKSISNSKSPNLLKPHATAELEMESLTYQLQNDRPHYIYSTFKRQRHLSTQNYLNQIEYGRAKFYDLCLLKSP